MVINFFLAYIDINFPLIKLTLFSFFFIYTAMVIMIGRSLVLSRIISGVLIGIRRILTSLKKNYHSPAKNTMIQKYTIV